MPSFVHATVDLGTNVTLGENTKVWHYAQVRENAILGEGCVIGRGAYVGTGVSLGKNCKVQNYALVYEPAVLGNGVFIGPAAVLTNDQFPRSVSPNMDLKGGEDWEAVGVTIEDGASIGARAVCVAPVNIGKWATIAAGAVVTKDVPDFALMMGVPARRVGWVGRQGHPLADIGQGKFECPVDGTLYEQIDTHILKEIVTK
jgi:UDP-2-acetamido-3-amino-2,3-dideoxy-glucuronate N-acetyltransferase